MIVTEALGVAAGVISTVCWVPQSVKIIRDRQTAGISLASNFLVFLTVALWFAYGVALGAWPLIAANFISGVLLIIIIGMKISIDGFSGVRPVGIATATPVPSAPVSPAGPAVAHVALWTADLDASVAFWAGHFGAVAGAEYASRNRPGFRSRFVDLASGARLELMTGPWVAAGDGAERAGWAHVAVTLGSEAAVDAAATELATVGRLVTGPRRTGDGYYEAVIRSPEGALVEITS
jgi:lactoylglutathione lyase